jgi:hypothetical protein
MLVVLGIVLVVIGAIVTFAIDSAVDGVDLKALGFILMGGGALALVAASVRGASFMSMGNKKFRSERHVSADGNHVVEETEVQ